MPSALWGWVQQLEYRISQIAERNRALLEECGKLKIARSTLSSMLASHNRICARQRALLNDPAMSRNRAGQMIRARLQTALDRSAAAAAMISGCESAAGAAQTDRETEMANNERDIQSLSGEAEYTRARAYEEDAMEANGNA